VAHPRAFRLKDHPSVIIFRDRSVLKDEERGVRTVCGRSEEKRSEEKRPVGGSRAALSRGTSERTGIARAAIARSVSLASVSAWLRPTFLHLAGERPLRFFVPRLNVSFRRRHLSLFLPSRRIASRDVQFPGNSISPWEIFSISRREFLRMLRKIREKLGAIRFISIISISVSTKFGGNYNIAHPNDKLYFLRKRYLKYIIGESCQICVIVSHQYFIFLLNIILNRLI